MQENSEGPQQRQFDRHCTGDGDPCRVEKGLTSCDRTIAGVQQKMNNMLTDPCGMFGGIGLKSPSRGPVWPYQ